MTQLTFTRRRQVRGRKVYNQLRRWAKRFGMSVEAKADSTIVAKVYGRRVQRGLASGRLFSRVKLSRRAWAQLVKHQDGIRKTTLFYKLAFDHKHGLKHGRRVQREAR